MINAPQPDSLTLTLPDGSTRSVAYGTPARDVVASIGITGRELTRLTPILAALARLFVKYDLTLAEMMEYPLDRLPLAYQAEVLDTCIDLGQWEVGEKVMATIDASPAEKSTIALGVM